MLHATYTPGCDASGLGVGSAQVAGRHVGGEGIAAALRTQQTLQERDFFQATIRQGLHVDAFHGPKRAPREILEVVLWKVGIHGVGTAEGRVQRRVRNGIKVVVVRIYEPTDGGGGGG